MCPSKYAASDLEGAETVDRPERICRGRCAAARAPHRRWLRRLVARQNAVKAVISIPTDGCPGRIRRRRVWSSPRGSSKRHPPQTSPDAVRADIDVLSRGDLDRASPRRRLDADVHRPWRFPSFGLSLLFQLFGLSLVKLEDPLARKRLLEPVEELCGRIDLVVMLAIGEDGHLVEVFGEPGRTLWDVDEPVFDHRRLRVWPRRSERAAFQRRYRASSHGERDAGSRGRCWRYRRVFRREAAGGRPCPIRSARWVAPAGARREQERKVCGLSAGGEWIRTSSTRARST